MNSICLPLQVLAILAIQYHGSDGVTIFKVCPDGYQLLRFVQPPLATATLQCTLFDIPNCVEQCYWAAIGESGGGTSAATKAGLRNRGDCGSYMFQDLDSTSYNVDVIGNNEYYYGTAASTWIEGGYATYINGLNYSTEGHSDHKRCCLSKLYKVKAESCGYSGGSEYPLIGYYRWASTIPTDPISLPEIFIDTTSTAVQDMANLPGNTYNPVRSNPIVRQLGFNNAGAYDYTIHLCDTEIDPSSLCSDTVTVSSNSGDIKGKVVDRDGKPQFKVFKGIPYAEPPTGKLRFSNPEPIANWSTEIDASGDFKAKCPQAVNPNNSQTDPTPVDEDCLFLNIFAPYDPSNKRAGYAVMVRIHGGGFFVGAGSNFKEDGILDGLVSKDTIVVTLNYRLGVFGFFNLRNDEIQGNFGLLDQVEALKWIRNNIQFFGGNPERITISGVSSGAICVSLLTLSPLAHGLFSRAIIQSGSALAVWAVTKDDDPHDPSKILLQHLSCNLTTNQEQMECIRGKPMQKIIDFSLYVLLSDNIYVDWNARIDGYFLPQSIFDLARQRNSELSVLIGVTKDEYGLFEFIGGPKAQGYVDSSMQTILPVINSSLLENSIANFMPAEIFPPYEAARDAAKCKYITSVKCDAAGLSEVDQREFWLNQSILFKSSLMFWGPTYEEAVLLQSTGAHVYFYEFDYLSKNALQPPPGKDLYGIEWRGVMHAVENFYIFGSNLDLQAIHPDNQKFLEPSPMTPEDADFAELIQTLWTNFVKFGNPTPRRKPDLRLGTWKRFNPRRSNYYSISLNPQMKTCFRKNDLAFWSQHYSFKLSQPERRNVTKSCRLDPCCNERVQEFKEFCDQHADGLKPNANEVFASCCEPGESQCPDDLFIFNYVCKRRDRNDCSDLVDLSWMKRCSEAPVCDEE